MTDEQMEKIIDRVSRNVYNIVLELGWHHLIVSQDDMGGVHETPRYEEVVKDYGS